LCDSIPLEKENNIIGSKLNRILCHYENQILQEALKAISERDIEVSTLMFDGCMVYGDHYSDLSVLESITTKCQEAFPSLNMKWDYKKHDTTTVYIPEGWKSKKLEKLNKEDNDEKKKESSDALFAAMSEELEKMHTKIINDSVFVKQLEDRVLIMSKKELITSYEHI
jgi:urocanate hydratase